MVTSDGPPEPELEGEFLPLSPYPMPVDIDDGIVRDINLTQEIFGVINQYGTDFEVMRFTLHNTLKDGIKVQVMSLGAALVGVVAPDRSSSCWWLPRGMLGELIIPKEAGMFLAERLLRVSDLRDPWPLFVGAPSLPSVPGTPLKYNGEASSRENRLHDHGNPYARKGVYKDVVLGFDTVENYYSPLNPGFGRITSLCPLPYNLEKVVWDWDFDRDEASVTFSTTFYRIDLVLCVKYTLNVCNEIIVDMKACGSKIVPISLTSQVYWNMAGHNKGQAALNHHALSVNSDRIWKHINHKLKNFFPIYDTVLDFRQPSLMNNPEIFGEKKFEHVYVITKGCKQSVAFVARLIHPRTCRYVEIFSDQPWALCNTLNKFARRDWDMAPCTDDYDDDGDFGECSEHTSDIDPCASDDERARQELMMELDEIPGKEGSFYRKYGGFCVTPLSDLTGFDPILRPASHYSHRTIYKIGIYRRYMKKSKKREEFAGEEEEEAMGDDVVDIDHE